jgi:magnesium transporter
VTDADQRIVGTVPVTRLALEAPDRRMEALVERRREAIDALATREEVVKAMTSLGVPSLAVVDQDGVLLGVLRHRTLVGAAEQEAFADLAAMVGASKDERALSPPTFAVKKRLPWLIINLFTAFLAAAVVGIFEETLARMTALAVLLPVVAGQSGNAGSQALAVAMRGLALREIRSTHWFRLALKEVMVGVLDGVAIAVICGAGVLVWSGSLGIAAVIAVAMVIAMAAAGLAGASIPLLLMRLGQDPATASSIILTTVTDVVGFMSFLGLATALLR